MPIAVTCHWDFRDSTPLNEVMVKQTRLAKLVLLYRRYHIVDQNFLPNVLKPWGQGTRDYNQLETPKDAYHVLKYAIGQGNMFHPHVGEEIRQFIFQYWPYFGPNLNWKVVVNFTEGQVPSITI